MFRYARLGCLVFPLATAACFPELTTESAPVSEMAFVATGSAHACGLDPSGQAVCWSAADRRPITVARALLLDVIATREDHTCGLHSSGVPYCWGFNTFGQLGTQAELTFCQKQGFRTVFRCSPDPIEVDGGLALESLDVGTSHTCGLDAAGTAYCWGSNGVGQLGSPSSFTCAAELFGEGIPCSPEPLVVTGGLTFASITAGSSHTCGLTASGEAYCWGSGSFGRLGNGDVDNRDAPTLVSGGITFLALSAGGAHTCGIADDERIYCWGSNSDLQLGSTDTELRLSCGRLPFRCVTTPSLVDDQLRFTSVSASDGVSFGGGGPNVGGHTCGITTDHRVFCWGLNESGQLLGTQELRSATPVELPVSQHFDQISAGRTNTCGLTDQAQVFCWAYGTPLAQWVVQVK